MAGDRIGILELEGVEERIFPDGVVALLLGADVGIVRIDTLVQGVRLLVSQGCRFRFQRVQQDFRNDFLVLIVGEREPRIGEMKPVPVLVMADADELADIAVGNVIRPLQFLGKMVAVLDDHQLVVPDQALLPELDLRPDAGVVAVRALVGPAQDDGLVLAVPCVCIGQCFDQFAARQPLHVVEPLDGQPQFIQRDLAVFPDQFP